MAIGSILKTITGVGQSVISVLLKNKFLATIFLLLILFLVGNTISGIFTGGYKCRWSEITGNGTMLVDQSLYEDCLGKYMYGALEKYKLNSSTCSVHPNAADPTWNATCQDVALYQARIQSVMSVQSIVERLGDKVFELMGRWFREINGSEIVDIFISPNFCPELYDCLKHDNDAIKELGLYRDCTMDDIPTGEQYENATITLYPDGVEMAGMFYIDCVASDQGNWKPRITFFGIDFLNWRLWIFIIILSTLLVFYRKWRNTLKI